MKIYSIGQSIDKDGNTYKPPKFCYRIDCTEDELEDLSEGLDAYIDGLEEFEQEDKSARVNELKKYQQLIARALNNP